MARELAYVLINPYTIAKSRTGGVIARYVGRTGLELVAARMFGPSRDLVNEYVELIRSGAGTKTSTDPLIADYVARCYSPHPDTGKPRRVLLLLFEGEDAVARVWRTTGTATLKPGSGETVRDTYGDYVLDDQGRLVYFEPAVLVAPTVQRAAAILRLWSRYSERDGGIVDFAADVPQEPTAEKTLVLLKPDNFSEPSFRAGNIIDILSSSGLRIVAAKKFNMTVAQAEGFYAPVKETLAARFKNMAREKVASVLAREMGFGVPEEVLGDICAKLAPLFANAQFESIVEFMTGYRPSQCQEAEKHTLGRRSCLALVYHGINAVAKIRSILGATDPRRAEPGSVRREFGSDIMVNAAHASDSPENALREMRIINVGEDTIRPWVEKYYGTDGKSSGCVA
ncbi:MAG: nucleoside-diphosphate kinase [Kiritimatiellae bacterium]|nr:nucleoside-diphosphate kinase [Kiritimatiellia bacterium]